MMYLAIQTPLSKLDPEEQLRPAIKCFKAANLEPQVRTLSCIVNKGFFACPTSCQGKEKKHSYTGGKAAPYINQG